MSRAVRIKERLLVRFISKALTSQKTRKRRFFTATDINLVRDQWMDISMVAMPELALEPIPDIGLFPAPDISLIDPFTTVSDKPNQNRSDVSFVLQLPIPDTNVSPAIPDTKSMHNETVDVEELVQALRISGAKVKEVRSLPAGGNCIKIEDLFVNHTERDHEYVNARRR